MKRTIGHIFKLSCDGFSNKEISEELNISEREVKSAVEFMMPD